MPRLSLLLAALAAFAPICACKKAAPDGPAQAPAAQPAVEILKDGRWLFTYVERDGKFATTDKPDAVPEETRRIVRVMDPTQPADRRLDTSHVSVVDLGALIKEGKARARSVPRDAFETAALAQLPPGRSSSRGARPAVPPPDERDAPDGGVPGASPAAGPPQVIVYGTAWCGACRSARQWLRQRGIPFVDKDVETDASAARELGEKAARLGVPNDRVPILDVRGRLLVGFDPARVEALLGS